ncbi:hypothetical protein PVAP13_9NG306173 [Panicum virgatum]|uniref:Ubiquitin-like protease family profile domain-containing protein n=1 Tax=Panicum virgatum TaxID=38727 RepID=A0A8T0MMI3_PANVG|nr:hypothetical protein PVAP13_9NG306173 [Panicum virgatum]
MYSLVLSGTPGKGGPSELEEPEEASSHCEPNSIIKAAKCLSAEAKDFVKDCGFSGILEINVMKLCSIETIVVMMDKCDVSSDDESFTIVISIENQIKVTSKSKEYYNFWRVLKDKGYDVVSRVKSKGKMQDNRKLPYRELLRYTKSVKDKREQAHAFFYIVLCMLLLATTSNVPTAQHVGMCSYIDSMKKYNWYRYICLLETLEPQPGLEETSADPLIKRYDDKKIENLVKNIKDTMNVRQEVNIVFTLVAFQIAKHEAKPQPSKVKKPASRKQKDLQLQNNEDLKKIVAEHSILSKMYNEIKYRAQIEDDKIKALMRDNCVMQINDMEMAEDLFVEIFKLGGHMHDDVLEALRLIWNKSWDDQIMLSIGAVIFVPFVMGGHWSLVVVEPDIEVIIVLDSFYELEDSTECHEQLVRYFQHQMPCKESLQSANYTITKSSSSEAKQPYLNSCSLSNFCSDDCGFHILLYIMRYKNGNYKNISEDEVFMCHKRIARFLLEHEDNTFRGAFTNSHSNRMLEDEDARTQKKLEDEDARTKKKGNPYQPKKKKQKDGEPEEKEEPIEDHENGNKDGGKDKEKKSTLVTKKRYTRNKKKLEGRSVPDALKCSIRKVMVFKGDCSTSPFKKEDTWTQNLGDKESRLQLWNKIVGNEELESNSFSFMSLHISKSFGAKICCEDTVVSFYVRCLIADEVHHGPDTVGYRIFLDPKTTELLLAPKDEYIVNVIAEHIKQQYNAQQILEARHIFLPVCYKLHWTVYVINKNYGQIDILDSMAWTVDEKRKYHQNIAGGIRTKLSDFCDLDDIRGKILWYLLHHNLNASANSLPLGIIDRGSPCV